MPNTNLRDFLESGSDARCLSDITPLVSIAISLKRLADMMALGTWQNGGKTVADISETDDCSGFMPD